MENHKFTHLGKSNPNMSLRWAEIAGLESGEGTASLRAAEGLCGAPKEGDRRLET